MEYSDIQTIIGTLFGCWCLGYGPAYLMKVIKQSSEKI